MATDSVQTDKTVLTDKEQREQKLSLFNDRSYLGLDLRTLTVLVSKLREFAVSRCSTHVQELTEDK